MPRKPRPRIGRPPLGPDARSVTFRLRLTPAERDALEASANVRGVDASELVRATLRAARILGPKTK
jgi:hypothetical protein